MRIAICVKKDLHGLLAARILARHLGHCELRFFCSVKTRAAEGEIPGLALLKLLERDIAIETLAAQQPSLGGVPHPRHWIPLADLKPDGGGAELLRFMPALVISARFSLIFPEALIAAVPHGIVNVHPGALPDYRGLFAPFWQIRRGEAILRCTTHLVDRGIDTGPIIGVAPVPLDRRRSLLWHIAALYRGGVDIAGEAAAGLSRGVPLTTRPQPPGGAYFHFPPAAEFDGLPIPLVTARDYAAVLAEAYGETPGALDAAA